MSEIPGIRQKFTDTAPGMDDADLRIEMFTLCEGVVEQNGRLSLVGTYDALTPPCLPSVIPQMTVLLRLRFWPGEGAAHQVRLAVIDPDGKAVGAPAEAMIQLNFAEEDRAANYNLIVHIQALTFEEPGDYTIDFHLNEALEGRLPFWVHQSPDGGDHGRDREGTAASQ